MQHKKIKAVFMGSADFAVPALEALNEVAEIALVVVQPDKKSGRGNKIHPLPVKKKALELGLDIYQPDNVSDLESEEILKETGADIFVVCAYGQILKENILDIPKYGSLNIHGSVLPKYRGAAPIQRSIINGEDTGGVSFMILGTGMDTGPVLETAEVKITDTTTFETLHDELADLGGKMLPDVLEAYTKGQLVPVEQDNSKATYADKIDKKEARINWNDPAGTILRFINGMDPVPGAFTQADGVRLKLFGPRLSGEVSESARPGEIVSSGNGKPLIICCGDGKLLEILELQAPGKRRMPVKEYFKGNKLPENLLLI